MGRGGRVKGDGIRGVARAVVLTAVRQQRVKNAVFSYPSRRPAQQLHPVW